MTSFDDGAIEIDAIPDPVESGIFGTINVSPVPAEFTGVGGTYLCGDVYSWAITQFGYLLTTNDSLTYLLPFEQTRRIELFPEAYDEVNKIAQELAAEELANVTADTAESVQADAEDPGN